MKAAKEEKEKLEAELRAFTEAKTKAEMETEKTKEKVDQRKNKNQENDKESPEPNIDKIEEDIRKLINEKRIIQTYQPITAMFDDETVTKEIYKTDLSAVSEFSEINNYLSNTSAFSIPLQQVINEWILRQVFLRITESGTEKCQYLFLISATESWFSDITLFQWLQKILSQTKKYNPGKSIILDVPLDLFNKHQKRAEALINTLRKSHQFTIALSNIEPIDNLLDYCSLTASSLLIVNIEQLNLLSETIAPHTEQIEEGNEAEEIEKQNMVQYLKSKNIKIITNGIEDSTLLMDAITAGTDYTLGNFVGEIQDNLVESSTVESFELT